MQILVTIYFLFVKIYVIAVVNKIKCLRGLPRRRRFSYFIPLCENKGVQTFMDFRV